jgi:hypothetical protein
MQNMDKTDIENVSHPVGTLLLKTVWRRDLGIIHFNDNERTLVK